MPLDEIDFKISLVNEIALELENLKKSLVNNNLLDSCTIQGATNDWYQIGDRTVAVEGIFCYLLHLKNIFPVDVSATNVTRIDRINTWMTCTNGCPSADGSNNIKLEPGQDLKFWVYIRRDHVSSFPVQFAKDNNFVIHYEVEGPCA